MELESGTILMKVTIQKSKSMKLLEKQKFDFWSICRIPKSILKH